MPENPETPVTPEPIATNTNPETPVATGPNPAGPDAPLDGFKPLVDGSNVNEAELAKGSLGHPVDAATTAIPVDGNPSNTGIWAAKTGERIELKAAKAAEPASKPWWKRIFHISEERVGQPANTLSLDHIKDGKTPIMAQVTTEAAQAVETPISISTSTAQPAEAAAPPPTLEPTPVAVTPEPAETVSTSPVQATEAKEHEEIATEAVIPEPAVAGLDEKSEKATDTASVEDTAIVAEELPAISSETPDATAVPTAAADTNLSAITNEGDEASQITETVAADSAATKEPTTETVSPTVEAVASDEQPAPEVVPATADATLQTATDGVDTARDIQPAAKVDADSDLALNSEPSAEDKDITRAESDTLVANSIPEYHPLAEDQEEDSLTKVGADATIVISTNVSTMEEPSLDPLPLVDTPKTDEPMPAAVPATGSEAGSSPVAADIADEPVAHEDPSAVTPTASAAGAAPATDSSQPVAPPATMAQPLEQPTIEPFTPVEHSQAEAQDAPPSNILQFPAQFAAEAATATPDSASVQPAEVTGQGTQSDKLTQPEEKALAA